LTTDGNVISPKDQEVFNELKNKPEYPHEIPVDQ